MHCSLMLSTHVVVPTDVPHHQEGLHSALLCPHDGGGLQNVGAGGEGEWDTAVYVSLWIKLYSSAHGFVVW